MYLYCILAVEARDARAPQSHNWSYNQLKAALLLLPSSFFGHLLREHWKYANLNT